MQMPGADVIDMTGFGTSASAVTAVPAVTDVSAVPHVIAI